MDRIKGIIPTDKEAGKAVKERWDSIAKPLGSFGIFEDMIQKIGCIQGTDDVDISKRTAVVMCGDHGVVSEGVTQCGSEVTAQCAIDIAQRKASINAIASRFDINVMAVDMGIASEVKCKKLINRKIAYGTRNMTEAAAMTPERTERAILAGMDIAGQLKDKGVKLLITGEMGIGNTTSAAAIASVMLGLPAEQVTGRGAGLSSEGLKRKITAVKKAVEVNSPDKNKPFEVLQKLGGFEIAGMTGLFLGGAYYHIPVVIDGVISAAAAAIAYGIQPLCGEYMLASHCSGEPAGEDLLKYCGLTPVINAGMRLGEGTGGAMLVPLLDGTLASYRDARRFDETPIERYSELK